MQIVTVTGNTRKKPYTFEISVDCIETESTAVHQIAARRIIASLADTDSQTAIEISKKYNIASPFTSFIAVPEEQGLLVLSFNIMELTFHLEAKAQTESMKIVEIPLTSLASVQTFSGGSGGLLGRSSKSAAAATALRKTILALLLS